MLHLAAKVVKGGETMNKALFLKKGCLAVSRPRKPAMDMAQLEAGTEGRWPESFAGWPDVIAKQLMKSRRVTMTRGRLDSDNAGGVVNGVPRRAQRKGPTGGWVE